MSRLFICIAVLLFAGTSRAQETGQPRQSAPAAPAAPRSSNDQWRVSETQVASVPAPVAFPRSAGVLTAQRSQEFSHEGEGIDNALQYRSADNAIFGTVYLYYPGLPHSGLAAFASDDAIRHNSTTPVTDGEMRVVAAGGIEGSAIRADYSNYRGMASSAAFIKMGRWIVKFRVSGPEVRRAEVDAAMDALLRGAAFGQATAPRRASPLTIGACPAGAGQRPATLLPDPVGPEIAAHAFLATFDGGGVEGTESGGARVDLPPRIPPQLCLSRLTARGRTVPILRAEPGEAPSIDGRTMLLVMLSDSGNALEVVHAANLRRYWLLFHEIGGTNLLGSFDGVPSDRQIAEILENPNAASGRTRAPVRFRPDQGPVMHLPAPPEGDAPASPPPPRPIA